MLRTRAVYSCFDVPEHRTVSNLFLGPGLRFGLFVRGFIFVAGRL